MKFIIAIIKPFLLDDVREALMRAGVHGMTVGEVKGFGRQRGHVEVYRGAEYTVVMVPKLRLELAVPDELVEKTVEALAASARTGKVGDGKIFVTAIESAVRIRTGESGEDAL
jgi:nitrogen regulatory protein PII